MPLVSFAHFAPSELPDNGIPTEFRLLAAGANPYMHEGDANPHTFTFDADSAAEVMQRFAASGRDRQVIDYEHSSLNPPADGAPAAGWFVPQVRNGELWATDVKWTKRAEQYLANKEYRFFSPTLELDEDGRVVGLRPVALTNDPALTNCRPLMAASRTAVSRNPIGEKKMKLVCSALGLDADADEAAALAVVQKLSDLKNQVLSLSNKASLPEALGALHAMKQAAAQVETLSAENATLKADKQRAEINALIDDATKDGRLPPAKRDEVIALSTEIGTKGLRSYLSALPRQPGQGVPVVAPKGEANGALTVPEMTVAKALGISTEAFAASKARFSK